MPTAPGAPTTTLEKVRAAALILLAVLAVVTALYFGRSLLVPIALALLFNALLRPVVRAFERARIPTPAGAAVVVLGLIAVLIVGGTALAGPVKQWMRDAPASFRTAEHKLGRIRQSFQKVSEAAEQLASGAPEGSQQPAAPAPDVPGVVTGLFGTTTSVVAETAEVLVLLYLLLASGNLFLRKLVNVLPLRSEKRTAVEVTDEMERVVARYMVTTLWINLGQGLLVGLAMWWLDMPSPVLWGLLTVAFEFVPYLGAAFMILLLSVAAFGRFDSVGHVLAVPGTYLLITTLQNNLVSPLAYGQRLRLNPVMVLVMVLFWYFIWGVPGAFLAVPFAASLKILSDHVEALHPLAEFLGE